MGGGEEREGREAREGMCVPNPIQSTNSKAGENHMLLLVVRVTVKTSWIPLEAQLKPIEAHLKPT